MSFHEAVDRGDLAKVKLLLSSDKSLVNSVNEQSMPPLHLACFRGHTDVAEFLLRNGADVNMQDKKQGYTALMFAAIAGNMGLTELLLRSGARSNYVNRVGRTAAQMASFVGKSDVAALINNFLEEEEVVAYTRLSAPANLIIPPNVADSLYRLILDINITPVKILLRLNACTMADSEEIHGAQRETMLSSWRHGVNVLEDLLEKYFTPHQTHEALALKFHLIACCLRRAGEYIAKQEQLPLDSCKESMDDPRKQVASKSKLMGLIREFLRGGDPHGLPVGQEQFLRQTLTSFPHRESTLWRHLVSQVSKVQPGYSPTALTAYEYAINGQRPVTFMGDVASHSCSTCGDVASSHGQIKLCHNCMEVGYCSVACQRLHWFTHKKYCPILRAHHDACELSRKKTLAKSPSSSS